MAERDFDELLQNFGDVREIDISKKDVEHTVSGKQCNTSYHDSRQLRSSGDGKEKNTDLSNRR